MTSARLALAATLALSACGVTQDGRPTVTLADRYTLVVRETGIEGGVKKGKEYWAGISVRWGK